MAKKYNCTKNGKQYFRIKRTINGKEKEFYGDGERDALRKYETYLKKLSTESNEHKAPIIFKDGIKHWLYDVKRHENTKQSSFARYECIYRQRLQRTNMDDLSVSDIKRFHAETFRSNLIGQGCTPSQISDTMKVAKMYFEYLLEEVRDGRYHRRILAYH